MINYLGLLVAVISGFVIGAAWHTVLGSRRMAASGMTVAEIANAQAARQMPVGPMIVSFVAQCVMALILSQIMAHTGGANVRVGAADAVLIWVGFVATTIGVNNAFEKRKPALTAIDTGHWLAVLIVQGIVLGLFG